MLAAWNLRPALAGVSPLLPDIMGDLGLTAAQGGAITTVMVVCLGLLGPLAPVLAGRVGLDRTLLVGLLLLAAGVLVRSTDGVIALYGGAALAGAAIAIMNVTMPALAKQHFPTRIGPVTGVYVSSLVAGAAVASAAMVPLAGVVGWRSAAGSAALLALLAALIWAPQALRTSPRHGGRSSGHRPYRALLRNRTTWLVTAFMGLQSLTFYVTLAWLPSIFQSAGVAADKAGYLLGLANAAQIAATLTVPVHAGSARSQVPHVTIAAILTIIGYGGVMLAPTTTPWLWMIVLGLGQGASIALALLLIALRAPDPASVTALSAVAQSSGYVLAAMGPVAFGLLHQLSGGWRVPLLAGIGVCVFQLAFGALAARPVPARV
ncbi:MFS transporter [Sphaerimonospora cavernae]|uniref:MFS transporter n=1 Tax=Sphaerimonospora cavernae TaxID=1740611 RepID=A0ABV6U719_9ACTN